MISPGPVISTSLPRPSKMAVYRKSSTRCHLLYTRKIAVVAFCIGTTRCRRTGHGRPNILWSGRDFFLTTFAHTKILRLQTRDEKRERAADPSAGDSRVNAGPESAKQNEAPSKDRASEDSAIERRFFLFGKLAADFGGRKAPQDVKIPFVFGAPSHRRTPINFRAKRE